MHGNRTVGVCGHLVADYRAHIMIFALLNVLKVDAKNRKRSTTVHRDDRRRAGKIDHTFNVEIDNRVGRLTRSRAEGSTDGFCEREQPNCTATDWKFDPR